MVGVVGASRLTRPNSISICTPSKDKQKSLNFGHKHIAGFRCVAFVFDSFRFSMFLAGPQSGERDDMWRAFDFCCRLHSSPVGALLHVADSFDFWRLGHKPIRFMNIHECRSGIPVDVELWAFFVIEFHAERLQLWMMLVLLLAFKGHFPLVDLNA